MSSPIPNEHFVREHKHRLGDEAYKGFQTTSYTLCLDHRIPFFDNKSVFDIFEDYLLKALAKHNVDAQVYLFMPDHCHFILQGKNSEANSKKAVGLFKQYSGFWLSKNRPSVSWQKDFWDHLLRKDEDLKTQIDYILMNPVRKELVSSWKSYPYKGSTVYNLEQWS